jgi:hypothetical protein
MKQQTLAMAADQGAVLRHTANAPDAMSSSIR